MTGAYSRSNGAPSSRSISRPLSAPSPRRTSRFPESGTRRSRRARSIRRRCECEPLLALASRGRGRPAARSRSASARWPAAACCARPAGRRSSRSAATRTRRPRPEVRRRTVLDRAGDAVGDFDAALFIGRHVADRRAGTREQRRVAEFVVEFTAVEATAADEIDEPVGDVETNPNAGRRRASVIAEREGRLDRHPRFQLALGRNDERSEPLRQRRCSRCKNLRKRSHDAGTFRRRQRRSRARARRALQCF